MTINHLSDEAHTHKTRIESTGIPQTSNSPPASTRETRNLTQYLEHGPYPTLCCRMNVKVLNDRASECSGPKEAQGRSADQAWVYPQPSHPDRPWSAHTQRGPAPRGRALPHPGNTPGPGSALFFHSKSEIREHLPTPPPFEADEIHAEAELGQGLYFRSE